MNREELAWAGGFFDGEGSIGCYRTGKYLGQHYKTLTVQICQAGAYAEAILRRFNAALGNMGRLRGPYSYKNRSNHSDRYTLSFTSFETAQAAIAMLWPFLSGAKRTAATAAVNGFHSEMHKK